MDDEDTLTPEEAAKELGVDRVTVYKYLREGILSARQGSGGRARLAIRAEDVAVLKEAMGRRWDLPAVAAVALQAHVASRSAERTLKRLMDVLGVNVPALILSDDDARDLYRRAKEQLDMPGNPSVAEMLQWSKVFYALGEEHLEQLDRLGYKEPWKLFLELAESMSVKALSSYMVKETEVAYGYLSMARNNVRNVAYFYVRLRFGRDKAAEVFPIKDTHDKVLSLAFPP